MAFSRRTVRNCQAPLRCSEVASHQPHKLKSPAQIRATATIYGGLAQWQQRLPCTQVFRGFESHILHHQCQTIKVITVLHTDGSGIQFLGLAHGLATRHGAASVETEMCSCQRNVGYLVARLVWGQDHASSILVVPTARWMRGRNSSPGLARCSSIGRALARIQQALGK